MAAIFAVCHWLAGLDIEQRLQRLQPVLIRLGLQHPEQHHRLVAGQYRFQRALHNPVRGFHPSDLVLPARKSSIFFKLPSYCITQIGLRRIHSSIIVFWLSTPPIIIGNDVLSWAASSSSKITTSKQDWTQKIEF